uniref:Complement factor H like 4 n=1 Tax=Oreochromis niloticus TaxID=8128 RepID=A0A669E7J4_ORENI
MRLSLILLFLQLWGHVEVSFSENVCSRLPNVPHSYVSENTKKVEYHEGDVIHFTCETGYISGPTIRYICTNTGWESIRRGKCTLKPCELPEDVPNGYYEIIHGEELVFGTAIKYFCNSGYTMGDRDGSRTCQLDGWSSTVPVCESKSFSQQPIGVMDPNLQVTGLPQGNEAIKTGDTLHFRCADQYKLEGSEVIECLETGYWNASFPSCSDPVGCEKPPLLSDGDTKTSTKRQYSHGESVEYICQNYYIMEGTPYKTCKNGKWTGQMRCLKPCTVNREDMRKHNIQFRYVSDDKLYSQHNDVIEFRCTRGRPVGSSGMRQKCIEGVMHLPTCQ